MEVLDGKVRWFHRNEHGETVFSAETSKQEIDEKTWTELAVTYDGHSGVSKIYKNGIMVKEEISDAMPLSSDWGLFAGNHIIKLTFSALTRH